MMLSQARHHRLHDISPMCDQGAVLQPSRASTSCMESGEAVSNMTMSSELQRNRLRNTSPLCGQSTLPHPAGLLLAAWSLEKL